MSAMKRSAAISCTSSRPLSSCQKGPPAARRDQLCELPCGVDDVLTVPPAARMRCRPACRAVAPGTAPGPDLDAAGALREGRQGGTGQSRRHVRGYGRSASPLFRPVAIHTPPQRAQGFKSRDGRPSTIHSDSCCRPMSQREAVPAEAAKSAPCGSDDYRNDVGVIDAAGPRRPAIWIQMKQRLQLLWLRATLRVFTLGTGRGRLEDVSSDRPQVIEESPRLSRSRRQLLR